jgi:type IV secretion system protein VirB9
MTRRTSSAKRLAGACLALASLVPAVLAAEDPRAGQLDARVRFVDYRPYQVVRVTGLLRHSIQIEFSPDEEILQAAIGNTVAWEAAPVGHILFLKPREQQEPTNMSVVTQRPDGTKRSYQFELMSADQDIKGERPFYLLKYQYPADEAAKRKAEAAVLAEAAKAKAAERALSISESEGPRNARYTVQGSASFEPRAVSDNGKITTFVFPENMVIPAIYLVSGDGTESLVPKTVSGSEVRVHAIAAKFVLRQGDDVLCIFNEAYVPEGLATGTMTTSPAVERLTRDDRTRDVKFSAGPQQAAGPLLSAQPQK